MKKYLEHKDIVYCKTTTLQYDANIGAFVFLNSTYPLTDGDTNSAEIHKDEDGYYYEVEDE